MINRESESAGSLSSEFLTFQSLTPKEQVVLQYIGEGYSQSEIKDILGISKSTLEIHRSHIANLGMHREDTRTVSPTVMITALLIDCTNTQQISHEYNNEPIAPLSQYERLVLDEFESGLLESEIAKKYGIGVKTIKEYVANIASKLGVTERITREHLITRDTYLKLHGLMPEIAES